MKTLNVSLTTELREYIDQQVAKGGYGTASEYIRNLIRQDQYRQAEEDLDDKLLEGLDSGEGKPLTKDLIEEIRRDILKKNKSRKAA